MMNEGVSALRPYLTAPERDEINKLEIGELYEELNPAEKFEVEKLLSDVPDLRDYIRAAWHVLEPGTPYVHGWHIDAISEHLEAVTAGQILRLIVNIPPGHMKSLSVSVFWPTWMWILRPHARFLFASYAQHLSTRDAVKSRTLLQSQWYQERWGDRFKLTGDQNEKTRYANDKTGVRVSTSVGSGTGERADFRVIDDPHNINDVHSDTIRESDIEWWRLTWSQRGSDARTSAEVIIMQRLHERDMTGFILAEIGGYEHLCLPARYEPDRACVTSLGSPDPRTEAGELIWPEKNGEAEVAEAEKTLGEYGAAGQLQQRPSPAGGGYFKEEWFRWYDWGNPPASLVTYGASDYAVTQDGGDWTVHGVIGVDPNDDIYLLDFWRKKTTSDVWAETAIDLMEKWKTLNWAEEKGQIEKSVGPFLDKRMRERRVYRRREQFTSATDKASRARSIQARTSMGKVYFPKGAPWVENLVHELLSFPTGVNDDQIDVLSLFGRMLDDMSRGRNPQVKSQPRQDTFDDIERRSELRRMGVNIREAPFILPRRGNGNGND